MNGYSEAFELFWKAYPPFRRKGKGDAAKSYAKAVRRVGTERNLTATEAAEYLQGRIAEFAESPVGKGQYCQRPAPWLNQACWDDAPEAWQREPPLDPETKGLF